MRRVELLTEARLQLRDIAHYRKMKVGPISAAKITDQILDAIDQLVDFPEMGALPPTRMLAEAGYRILVVKKYLCFYYMVGDVIYVAHIVHGSTDYIKNIWQIGAE